MKKTIILAVAAVVALASCTKERDVSTVGDAPITLSGVTSEVDGTRAPVTGTSMSGLTARILGSSTPGDYTTLYTSNANPFDAAVTFDAAGKGVYSPLQYYPSDGGAVYVKGFYPAAATAAVGGNTVSFTITGNEDILISNEVSGTKAASAASLTFGHVLSQLQFTVKAEDAAAVAMWGSVTKIEVLARNTKFDVALGGNTPANASTPSDLTVAGSSVALSTTLADAGNIMVLPLSGLSAGSPLKIKVYTTATPSGREVSFASLAGNASTAAGSAYKINLSFRAAGIELTATLTDWITGAPVSQDIF